MRKIIFFAFLLVVVISSIACSSVLATHDRGSPLVAETNAITANTMYAISNPASQFPNPFGVSNYPNPFLDYNGYGIYGNAAVDATFLMADNPFNSPILWYANGSPPLKGEENTAEYAECPVYAVNLTERSRFLVNDQIIIPDFASVAMGDILWMDSSTGATWTNGHIDELLIGDFTRTKFVGDNDNSQYVNNTGAGCITASERIWQSMVFNHAVIPVYGHYDYVSNICADETEENDDICSSDGVPPIIDQTSIPMIC